MVMLFWLPAIVMAGVYRAMSDDLSAWRRAFVGNPDRGDV